VKIINFLFVVLLFSASVQAEKMYIDDILLVPLRSGQDLSYRIVHKGVKSGTTVEVLEGNADSGYTKIREPGGIEGWMPTRYLVSEPIARDRLAATEKKLATLEEKSRQITTELAEFRKENTTLKIENERLIRENSSLGSKLESITEVSRNAITLDNRNRELQEENQHLQNELDLIQADNQRLKDNKESDFILLGGGLVALGVFIALIVPVMKPNKKRDSWA
jgi:SH3 domain protein